MGGARQGEFGTGVLGRRQERERLERLEAMHAAPAYAVALLLAFIGAFVYGRLLGALGEVEGEAFEVREVSYGAVPFGALVGLVIGRWRAGPALWLWGALLAAAAVFAGELYGHALLLAERAADAGPPREGALPAEGPEVHEATFPGYWLFDHLDGTLRQWLARTGPETYVFGALTAVTTALTAARTSRRRRLESDDPAA
ncbi:hypothetical protein [Streptomyces sp. N35]|uniref:hypothetical protein n=1 Tax=Streptomyces sp. N35 TaxID=2795730 RepID=UPI0018F2A29D|nr:hypothetical protein [Streptomyces sp. N35]